MTNDPNRPQVELTVTGKVIQTLIWEPARLRLGPIGRHVSCPDITIRSTDDKAFSIKAASSSNQCMAIDIDPQVKASRFVLRPKIDLDRLEGLEGGVGILILQLDHPDYRQIEIGIDVIPALEARPSQVIIFGTDGSKAIVRQVRVIDNLADPNGPCQVQIASVASKMGTQVELIDQAAKSNSIDLKLQLRPARPQDDQRYLADQLLIRLTDGRELQLPVRIFIQSTSSN